VDAASIHAAGRRVERGFRSDPWLDGAHDRVIAIEERRDRRREAVLFAMALYGVYIGGDGIHRQTPDALRRVVDADALDFRGVAVRNGAVRREEEQQVEPARRRGENREWPAVDVADRKAAREETEPEGQRAQHHP